MSRADGYMNNVQREIITAQNTKLIKANMALTVEVEELRLQVATLEARFAVHPPIVDSSPREESAPREHPFTATTDDLVTLGRHGTFKNRKEEQSLEVGQMTVANTEKYKPFGFAQQVGKVLEISEDYVTIHWYEVRGPEVDQVA